MENPLGMNISVMMECNASGRSYPQKIRSLSLNAAFQLIQHKIDFDSDIVFEIMSPMRISYLIYRKANTYTKFLCEGQEMIADSVRYIFEGPREALLPILEYLHYIGKEPGIDAFDGEFPLAKNKKPTWLVGMLLSQLDQLVWERHTNNLQLLEAFGIDRSFIEALRNAPRAGITCRIYDANEYWFLDPDQPIEDLIRTFALT